MKIPIFLSCPTSLSGKQEASRTLIVRELKRASLEARALGRSDYPTMLPLREVLVLAKHCAGGIILGFEQFQAISGGIWKPSTAQESRMTDIVRFPTPWNHLEAGILYALGLPLLVFTEHGLRGGIFDLGTSEAFIHSMPEPDLSQASKRELRAVFQKWQSEVRSRYYHCSPNGRCDVLRH